MIPPLLRLANAVVRAWTRVYTWRVPSPLREARREEIESDLWEREHDPVADGRFSLPLRVVARMLIGIPDDLGWRVEQVNIMDGSLRFRIALTVGVAGLLGLWLVIVPKAKLLPPLPGPPRRAFTAHPPPPPPPPPPAPASLSAKGADLQVTYGQTSYSVASNMKPPRKIKDVRPVYPPIAKAADMHGVVTVEATIDERGRVVDARVTPSIRMLDQAAIDAVQQWEFEPTKVNGAPVQVPIKVTVTFTPPP